MGVTKVPGSQLNVKTAIDGNSWTVFDFGTFKQYRKRGSFGFTVAANAWTASYNSGNLPVAFGGVVPANATLEGSIGNPDSAVTSSMYVVPGSSTVIYFPLTNQYGGGVTNTVQWSACFTVT